MAAGLTFGAWLKRRRQGLGLTQKELARRCGYAAVSVRKVEADERRPSREMAERLAEQLEIDPADRERFVRFARDQSGWDDVSLAAHSVTLAAAPEGASAAPGFLRDDADEADVAPSAFVGREQLLHRLDQFLGAAVDGRGRVVFVTGEAGSGKTSLLRAFARRAQDRHPELIVADGACHIYTGAGDPYMPFREIMAMLCGDVEARWASGSLSRDHALRIWQRLPQTVDVLVSRGPDLLGPFVSPTDLLARAALHSSQRTAWRERLATLAAHAGSHGPDQSRLFEEYLDVLQTLAGHQPILLLLDDLHWADVSSVGLLFHIARAIGDNRILVVGAYRPEEVHAPNGLASLDGVVREIQRQYGDVKIRLDQDEAAEGRRFVADLLNLEPNRLDEGFRQALYRHGRGHPLFTVELLRDLQDRGVLVRDDGGRWVAGGDLTWDTVPARVEGVIGQRVGRLDDNLRRLLSMAGVAGERFAAEVVAEALQIDARQVVRWLSEDLQRRHRLVRAEGMRSVGERRLSFYRFGHSLFQRYLYHSLDDVERTYLHEAVGRALERIYDGQEELVESAGALARHFEEARIPAAAGRYRLMAGRHAAQLSAHREAIAHFNQGLAQIDLMPDTPERRRRELALRLALAVSITTTSGYANPEAYRVYARARTLAEQAGDGADSFQAIYGLWRYAVIGAQLDEAEALGRQLMELAAGLRDAGLRVEAHRAMGVNHFHVGDFAAARPLLEAGIALYDAQQHGAHAYQYGHDPAISCLAYLAHTQVITGRPEQATETMRTLVRLAWELAHPFSLAYTHGFGAAMNCQLRHDVAGVLRWADDGLALSKRRGFPFWQAQAMMQRGWALAAQGGGPECLVELREGLALWRDTGARGLYPYFVCLLGEACARTGEIDAGLAAVDDGLAAAARTDERFYEAELHRTRGELLLLAGARPAAGEALRRAQQIAHGQGAVEFERRAVESASRWAAAR